MQIHAASLVERKWEQRACMEIRKHLVQYVSGFDGVKILRQRLAQVTSLEDVVSILDEAREVF